MYVNPHTHILYSVHTPTHSHTHTRTDILTSECTCTPVVACWRKCTAFPSRRKVFAGGKVKSISSRRCLGTGAGGGKESFRKDSIKELPRGKKKKKIQANKQAKTHANGAGRRASKPAGSFAKLSSLAYS